MLSGTFDRSEQWEEVEEALRKIQGLATAGQYAAMIVHDINNPLEAASNLAYLLQGDANDPQKVREYARLLEEQLAVIADISRRTFDYYRNTEDLKAIDLVEIANAAFRIHEHKILGKDLRVRKILPERVLVRAHAGELLQVLANLLANALDALPKTGTLSLKIRKCDKEVHLLVVDNGHGIPEESLAKIFDPFFTTKGAQGTGLGLAISKSIIERHHGKIRARSCVRTGRSGTAFRITLPLFEKDMQRLTGRP